MRQYAIKIAFRARHRVVQELFRFAQPEAFVSAGFRFRDRHIRRQRDQRSGRSVGAYRAGSIAPDMADPLSTVPFNKSEAAVTAVRSWLRCSSATSRGEIMPFAASSHSR